VRRFAVRHDVVDCSRRSTHGSLDPTSNVDEKDALAPALFQLGGGGRGYEGNRSWPSDASTVTGCKGRVIHREVRTAFVAHHLPRGLRQPEGCDCSGKHRAEMAFYGHENLLETMAMAVKVGAATAGGARP
jgi:hypothetical protein